MLAESAASRLVTDAGDEIAVLMGNVRRPIESGEATSGARMPAPRCAASVALSRGKPPADAPAPVGEVLREISGFVEDRVLVIVAADFLRAFEQCE